MNRQALDHILSIAAVVAVFAVVLAITQPPPDAVRQARESAIAPYLDLDFLDYGSPLDRALIKEAITEYYPRNPGRGDSLLAALDTHRREMFTTSALKTGAEQPGLSTAKLGRLAPMFLQFIAVYVLVLVLSTYGARTLGTYRFIRAQQGQLPAVLKLLQAVTPGSERKPPLARALQAVTSLFRGIVHVVMYAILFAPAFVIAYSFRSRFEGGAYLSMLLLGVVSNGLLITYANRFFTFLMRERKKGYVQTALVKNLHASYSWNLPDGISRRMFLVPTGSFRGHVFHHIYANAWFQYIPTVKQQASFLITGLVIIEMALNVQGHLCYELLQNILFRDYEVVAVIITAIFLIVKATDIAVDLWFARETRRYENVHA